MKLYAAYRATEHSLFPLKSIAFIDYVRTHQVVAGSVKLRPTTGGGHNAGKTTTAVGVRFGYEMHDQYIFHYCAMFFPTLSPRSIYLNGVFFEVYYVLLRVLAISYVPITW